MDFADLQVFRAVADEGGVTHAARRLHRVQSSVTMRIRHLEASLGTPLFIRERRRMVLSPAGVLFRGYVDRLLALGDEARAAAASRTPQGVLRLGTLESTAASRLPPLLSRYHQAHAGVRIELSTGTTDALVEAVLQRRVDAAFVAEAPRHRLLDRAAGIPRIAGPRHAARARRRAAAAGRRARHGDRVSGWLRVSSAPRALARGHARVGAHPGVGVVSCDRRVRGGRHRRRRRAALGAVDLAQRRRRPHACIAAHHRSDRPRCWCAAAASRRR